MRCKRCGRENPANARRCIYCNTPFYGSNSNINMPQNRRGHNSNRKNAGNKKTDNIIIGAIIALVLVLATVIGVYAYQNYTPKKGFRSGGGGGGIISSNASYVVSFDLNYDGATGVPQSQTVKHGDYVKQPETPVRDGYQFIGWFKNKEEKDWKNTYKFGETPVTAGMKLYAIWINPNADADGDGLADDLENYVGSDKNVKDTDGDNLSDYQEVAQTGTSPIKADTDGNGVSDYDEDADGDKLTNGSECANGTNPINTDTDGDRLGDYEEIHTHGTSPVKSDTDGDGAADDWEIEKGYNPLQFNSVFTVEETAEEVSDSNPVSASVKVNLNGGQVDSFSITPVSVADNPFMNQSVPGYLGKAYDFYVDGSISSARLTFRYDTALGTIGTDFQPRIYYFNSETREFEELSNQTVSNGVVSATTSHFSTYILLNKVAFDKVWYTEIRKPVASNNGIASTLDVAFVIDVSSSMRDERINTAKNALTSFLNVLEEKDRAALVKFNSESETVIGLTENKEDVKGFVSSLRVDGLTSMYKGFGEALDLLTVPGEAYGYKMIILLSDGKDEPSTNYASYYESLVNTAVSNNILVYTIGVGDTVDTSILKRIANNTGGAYYHATETSGILEAFNIIQKEAVDLTTDSNGDGISDYYTELIKNGELVVSNGSREFAGIDFNNNSEGELSADYDGDGLKNGEELIVVSDGNRVYMTMKSNPTMQHSDLDAIDDKTEHQNGTDPMMYQISDVNSKQLYDDTYYNYENAVQMYDTNLIFNIDTTVLSAIFGVWNIDELHRDIIIDYFANYADDKYVEGMETDRVRKTMTETLSEIVSNMRNAASKPYKEVDNIIKLISKINGTYDPDSVNYLLIKNYKEVVQKVYEFNPELTKVRITSYTMKSETTRLINLTAVNKGIDKVCKGLTYASYALDIADTIDKFAKVDANMQAFENNIDILREIKERSSDEHARDAAAAIMDKLAGSIASEIVAVGGDALETAGKMAISALAKSNIYVAAVVAVRDGIDIITGISQDLKQQYQMICYERMVTALQSLFDGIVTHKNSYYYVSDANIETFKRYLINFAQLRILGEKKFCEWQEYEGFIGWFTDNSETEKRIENQIQSIKNIINSLGLNISSKL